MNTGSQTNAATLTNRLTASLAAALLLSLPGYFRAADAARAGPVDRTQAAATGFSSERLAKLDQYMRDKVATGHMPAATIMVARHGHQVLFQSYGTAKPDTIFRIYSMTKPVTGFALMLLFEEARWRFDDPVTKFLPELANVQVYKATQADGTMETEPLKRPPTMRELVTNSAGYAYGLSTDHPAEKAYQDTNFLRAASANAAVAGLATVPMFSQPGMHWHYSAASDLQGYIIERLSGMTLAEFMQRRIFGPLKMKDTAFYVPADKTARFTPVLTLDTKSNTMVPATGVLIFDYSKPPGAASGGAGLVSTTHDYARFTQMVLNGGQLDGVRIISPLALKQYRSNQLADKIRDQPDEPFQTSSGVGFAVDTAIVVDPAKAATLQGLGTISWSGAAGTWFWIDPTNDLYCVGMMQVMDRWRDPALVNIEPESSALLYSALVDPRK